MARTAKTIGGEYKQRHSIYVTPTEYQRVLDTITLWRNTESELLVRIKELEDENRELRIQIEQGTTSPLRNTESIKILKLTKKIQEQKSELEALKSRPESKDPISFRDDEEKQVVLDILSVLRDSRNRAKRFVDYVKEDVFDVSRANELMDALKFYHESGD